MIQRASSVSIAGAVLLGALSLGGCATKKYVNEQVGVVSGRVTDHDAKLANLDTASREALARAEAAGKLAEGKFVYSMVLSDDSVKFPAGKATLSPEAASRLDAFAEKLKTDNRNVYVEVQGHADAAEGAAARRLGAERADVVRRHLNKQGVALNRISTISYGSETPVGAGRDAASRQANRRVVLIVLN